MYRDFKISELPKEKLENIKIVKDIIFFSKISRYKSGKIVYSSEDEEIYVDIKNRSVSMKNKKEQLNIDSILLELVGLKVQKIVMEDYDTFKKKIRLRR